ncbi:MAG: hypothetical protein AUF79_14675 [Crenarchaeota archaeon 13_1_20CM_2_51_8]|nr:MAG: hypothetical protein AUF79_14675 [Crenarchaeota archaeon 13_1_20CM_2_51_8]
MGETFVFHLRLHFQTVDFSKSVNDQVRKRNAKSKTISPSVRSLLIRVYLTKTHGFRPTYAPQIFQRDKTTHH